MTELRYLLDEHVERALAIALRRRDPELTVWRVGDPGAPPYGTPDPGLLEWCWANGFVLVTNTGKRWRRTL